MQINEKNFGKFYSYNIKKIAPESDFLMRGH